MFIKYERQLIVNLENVSNIYIDTDIDAVIFSMNYSVKFFEDKFIPDYVCWLFNTKEELQAIKDIFEPKVKKLQWFHPEEDQCVSSIDLDVYENRVTSEPDLQLVNPVEKCYKFVNPKCVSSIGLDGYKNRVTFKLNYNVTYSKDNSKFVSDSVFFDFSSVERFENFKNTWL
jgi:hypothetical protein